MRKFLWILPIILTFALSTLGEAKAQENKIEEDVYFRAKVLRVLEEGNEEVNGKLQQFQKLELEIQNGDKKDQRIIINHGLDFVSGNFKKVNEGESIVIVKPANQGEENNFYYIADQYRLPQLTAIILIFLAVAVYFGRRRGATAIAGMAFTVLVIFVFVLPQILKGANPFLVSISGALAIILVSLYLSHGFNKRTSIALVSTILTLGAAVIFDLLFVFMTKLSGNSSEEAFFLQLETINIDLRGLLLGGIIIGVVGVLDDITTAQAAVIEEIKRANPSFTLKQLYKSGISVGREHIASLINTLFLAYVGASFPLFLLFTSQQAASWWLALNSNFIAEEIVRTLVGSISLVIAVPLTTFLAAYFYSKE